MTWVLPFETEEHLWTFEARVLEYYLGHRAALPIVEMPACVSVRCAFLIPKDLFLSQCV